MSFTKIKKYSVSCPRTATFSRTTDIFPRERLQKWEINTNFEITKPKNYGTETLHQKVHQRRLLY